MSALLENQVERSEELLELLIAKGSAPVEYTIEDKPIIATSDGIDEAGSIGQNGDGAESVLPVLPHPPR